eukprot:scaffold10348_cov125-Isochrysis_galbana.AAC.2
MSSAPGRVIVSSNRYDACLVAPVSGTQRTESDWFECNSRVGAASRACAACGAIQSRKARPVDLAITRSAAASAGCPPAAARLQRASEPRRSARARRHGPSLARLVRVGGGLRGPLCAGRRCGAPHRPAARGHLADTRPRAPRGGDDGHVCGAGPVGPCARCSWMCSIGPFAEPDVCDGPDTVGQRRCGPAAAARPGGISAEARSGGGAPGVAGSGASRGDAQPSAVAAHTAAGHGAGDALAA